jgi:hypothetical protein
MMIPHHPYADNSKESIEGTEIDGKQIPGVGSPHSPEAMSVFTIDLTTNKVIHKFKTGFQLGEMIEEAEVVGGASPNSIAVGKRFAYVQMPPMTISRSLTTKRILSKAIYRSKQISGSISTGVCCRSA